MIRINDIPVRVEPSSVPTTDIAVSIQPFLAVLESMLLNLIADGLGDSLDLRRAPLSEDQRLQLRSVLGSGEAYVRIEALGRTEFEEMGVKGLWWVTHRNPRGEIVAEFIEAAYVPTLLSVTAADVAEGVQSLRGLMFANGQAGRLGEDEQAVPFGRA